MYDGWVGGEGGWKAGSNEFVSKELLWWIYFWWIRPNLEQKRSVYMITLNHRYNAVEF